MIHPGRPHPTLVPLLCAALLAPFCGCAGEGSPSAADGQLDTVAVLGESGRHNAQFVYPRGMDIFDIHGRPHAVLVDKTARIQVMDLTSGSVIGAIHTPRWDRGMPTGLTVQTSVLNPEKLAIYVADTHEHRVLMYELPLTATNDPQPTEPDLSFGEYGHEPGQFVYPTDIAVELGPDGRVQELYVSEYGGNDRINRFEVDHATSPPTLRWESQLGVAGQEVDASDHPLALARPQGIELWTGPGGQREIVLTDASHHRVGRMTTDGELIAWYGDPLDFSEDSFRFPYGLTILDDGTALIAEFGGNRVRCIDLATGETVFRYGVPGRAVGQLAQPWAVGVMGETLVILDSGNNRLQICELPRGIDDLGAEYTIPGHGPAVNAETIGSRAP